MDKQFPVEFTQLMNAPGVKAACVSEITSPYPDDCPNCGGVGTMYIFIATVGPLRSPASGRLVSHWSDGKWWGGKGFEAVCPVCRSAPRPYSGTDKTPMQPGPAKDAVDEVAEKLNHTDDKKWPYDY